MSFVAAGKRSSARGGSCSDAGAGGGVSREGSFTELPWQDASMASTSAMESDVFMVALGRAAAGGVPCLRYEFGKTRRRSLSKKPGVAARVTIAMGRRARRSVLHEQGASEGMKVGKG